VADSSAVDAALRAQYEAYPYPPRDPREEATRLITGSPSHLDEVNHYVFAGRRDFARPFRALVAGGGTGDGTIMIAQQLADRGSDGEVVYVDVSEASFEIARDRAAARGLANIKFLQHSLIDLPSLDLGPFDYIDCCGVLHHLDDPQQALCTLAALLAPGGGIGLMLYGALGRTGVYEAQRLLRLIANEAPAGEKITLARTLLNELPPTNWLNKNDFLGDHRGAGDAGVHDLLLNPRDRAYLVPEIFELARGADLAITAFIEPARYVPEHYLEDAGLRERVAGLTWPEGCAAAELIAGNLKVHICYLVRATEHSAAPPTAAPQTIPLLREIDPEALARQLDGKATLSANFDGAKIRFALPTIAAATIRLVNGIDSLEIIHARLAGDHAGLSWPEFQDQFSALYRALNGLNLMLLRAPTAVR
jgi:SAM-dependent methyltransferase